MLATGLGTAAASYRAAEWTRGTCAESDTSVQSTPGNRWGGTNACSHPSPVTAQKFASEGPDVTMGSFEIENVNLQGASPSLFEGPENARIAAAEFQAE